MITIPPRILSAIGKFDVQSSTFNTPPATGIGVLSRYPGELARGYQEIQQMKPSTRMRGQELRKASGKGLKNLDGWGVNWFTDMKKDRHGAGYTNSNVGY